MTKRVYLGDAARALLQMKGETQELEEANEKLQDTIKDLKAKKNELRDDEHATCRIRATTPSDDFSCCRRRLCRRNSSFDKQNCCISDIPRPAQLAMVVSWAVAASGITRHNRRSKTDISKCIISSSEEEW